MVQTIDKILKCYGTGLVLKHGKQEESFRGFLQPSRSKSLQNLEKDFSSLGQIPDGIYVLLAPANISAESGDMVLGSAKLGGLECEKAGAAVCDVLQGMGANCIQNACQFQSKTGLFCVEVEGRFLTEQPSEPDAEPVVYSFSATVAGKAVENLVSATAYRMWSEETGTVLDTWTVQLVEQITGAEDDAGVEEPFEIRLTRNDQTDIFAECTWSSWRRVLDSSGLKQTRSAVAQSRTVVTAEETAGI